MKRRKNIHFFVLPFAFCFSIAAAGNQKNNSGQDTKAPVDTAYNKNYIRYENYTYNGNIKTVLLHKDGFELSAPAIELHGTDKLNLSFDDLDANMKEYFYTFIHCDANWQP